MMNWLLKIKMNFMYELYRDLIESIENEPESWDEYKKITSKHCNYTIENHTSKIRITCNNSSPEYTHIYVNGKDVSSEFAKSSRKIFNNYIYHRKLQRMHEYKRLEYEKFSKIKIKTKKNSPEEYI